ncbi:hypothetical protein ACHAQJ_006756 [Trichoderma viride]
MYLNGKQEEFTAAAGSKVYPLEPGFHKRGRLRQKFSESLTALQTESVDIFYLRAADRSVPFAETLEAANEMYKEGKFRCRGLSNYAAFEVAEIVTMCTERGWVRPTIYQAMYNAITRSSEAELIPCCCRYGMVTVVYNPLAGSIFSGKYQSARAVPDDGRYSDKNTSGAIYRERYLNDAVLDSLKIVQTVAEANGLSFRWLLHHSQLKLGAIGNDGLLVGDHYLRMLFRRSMRLLGWALRLLRQIIGTSNLVYSYDTEAALFMKDH